MFPVFRFHSFLALFLQLIPTGQAQRSVGYCNCKETQAWSQDEIVNRFQRISETNSCSSTITEITFLRRVICGKTKDSWVQQIISCIKQDPKPCLKPTITPVRVTTTSTSTTLHIVLSSSSSASTTEPLRVAETVTSATSSTTEPSHITGVTTNSAPSVASRVTKSTADSAAENGAGEHRHNVQNTPTTATEKTKHLSIAVISLLAVVFILAGLVAFLICRRRRAKQQPYEAVETTILENGVLE